MRTRHQGVALQYERAGDNRVTVLDWTGLSSLGSSACSSCSTIMFGGKTFTTQVAYKDEGQDCLAQFGGVCGLGAQKAGPIPLGDNCYIIPTTTTSCPENGIATNGDGTNSSLVFRRSYLDRYQYSCLRDILQIERTSHRRCLLGDWQKC